MESNNKGNIVLLTVIGVATLLVALVGATFAYFTASVGTGTQSVSVTTTTLASVELTYGNAINPTNVYPGYADALEMNLELSAANTADSYYKIHIDTTNTMTTSTPTFTLYYAGATQVTDTTTKESVSASTVASTAEATDTGTSVTGNLIDNYLLKKDLTGGVTAYFYGNSYDTNDFGTATVLASQNVSASGSYDLYVKLPASVSSGDHYFYLLVNYANTTDAGTGSNYQNDDQGKTFSATISASASSESDFDSHTSNQLTIS